MPKYITTDGRTIDVPENEKNGFELAFPDAKVEYEDNGEVFHVPISDIDGFLEEAPNATFSKPKVNPVVEGVPAVPMAENVSVAPTPSKKPKESPFGINANIPTVAEIERGMVNGVNVNPFASLPNQPIKPITEFGEGVKEGGKQLVAGAEFAVGETLRPIVGTSEDDEAALERIESLEKEGKDVAKNVQSTATISPAMALGLKVFGPKGSSAFVRTMEKTAEANIAAQKALKEADGNVEQAKSILEEKANKQTIADTMRKDAERKMAEARPTKGWGWVGSMIPQMVGTGVGLGMTAVTKNPMWAQAIGLGNMAVLTTSAAGSAMAEARQSGASNAEVWTAGLLNGVIENVSERFALGKYTKGLFNAAKKSGSQAVKEAVAEVGSPARKELAKLLDKANKQLDGKLLSGKNVEDYIVQVWDETLSEGAAEALQTITPMLYQNPDEYPNLWGIVTNVANNALEGMKGGFFMGSILGGLSKSAEHRMNRARRKAQGFVDVAEVINPNGTRTVVEVVKDEEGQDAYIEGGEFIPLNSQEVGRREQFKFDDFERGQFQNEQDESYDIGKTLETPQEMKDANTMLQKTEAEVRRLYGDDAGDANIDELLGDNPLEKARQMYENDEEGGQAILDYLYAKATVGGIIDAARERISNEATKAEAVIDYRKNKSDGMIHPATLKNGDRQVYVVSGDIVTFDDGVVNTQKSSDAIIVQDAVTGKAEYLSSKDLLRAEKAINPEDEKKKVRATIGERIATDVENKLNGVLAFNLNDTYEVLNPQGERTTVQVVSDNGDGTIDVIMGDVAEPKKVTKNAVQTMADNLNSQRADEMLQGRNEMLQSEKLQKEAEQMVVPTANETPAEVAPAPRVVPTTKDGKPDFNAMDAEMFVEEYASRYGEENTAKIARKNIAVEREKIAKLDKKIDDVTDPNQIDALYEQRQASEAVVNRYNEILERLGLSEDANETEADQKSRLRNEANNRIASLFPDGMPNVESFILADIATGNRLRWSDKETNGVVTSRGLGAELGLSETERRRILPLIDKDAMTPEEYAESLRERLDAVGIRYDESSLRDAVLDVYSSVDSRKGAWDALENISKKMQEPQADMDWEDMQQQLAYNKAQENVDNTPELPSLDTIEEETPISEGEYAEMEQQAQAEEQADYDAMMEENPPVRSVDNQGNLIDTNGVLVTEKVESIDDITDEDFENPYRSIELPTLPQNVDNAIGANGKPIVIKKNIFERNIIRHSDLNPEQSRDILKSALYTPNLYGQNQKRQKPYNWVVVSTKDANGQNKLVLLEISDKKDNVEIVHWHFVDARGLEKLKRQAEREDGQLLILPSESTEEVGALSDPTLNISSESKDNAIQNEKQEISQENAEPSGEKTTPTILSEEEYVDAELIKLKPDEMSMEDWEYSDEYVDAYNKAVDAYPNYIKSLADSGALQEAFDKGTLGEQIAIRKNIQTAGFEVTDLIDTGKGKKSKAKKTRGQELMENLGLTEKEDARRKPLRERASMWEDKVGVKVNLIEDFEDIPTDAVKRVIDEGQRVTGWVVNGEVFLYMPYIANRTEVDKTYLHEVVAHVGMKELLGKDGYKAFCERVFNEVMTKVQQDYYRAYQGVKNDAQAADEFIAHLAEDVNMDATVWQKIVKIFRDALHNMGIDTRITNADIEAMLRDSYKKLVEENGMAGINEKDETSRFMVTDRNVQNVILEDTEERKLPTTRKEAFEYIPEGGVSFYNKDVNANIKVSRKAVKHTSLHNQQDAYAIFAGMEDIIGNSVKIGNIPVAADEVGHTHSVSVMYVPVNINGTQYSARLIIKELENKGVVLEELSLYNVSMHKEKSSAVQPLNASNEVGGITAKPYSYYKVKDLIHNSQEEDKKILGLNENTRFRTAESAPVFYSNAEYAVKAVKQDKATPEQWLKMIEKNGGLKAGEDKWLGLSDWLKSSDKKTLTKQEVLDFIKENQIQIEEVVYGSLEETPRFKELRNEYKSLLVENDYNNERTFDAMVDKYGEDFELAFEGWGNDLHINDYYGTEAADAFLDARDINDTRIQYTTDGLDNKREIALTVPTIESWNESDEIHFGDAGNGRAIAWVRFGETTDADGNRVLVIDEVQSKRHQEGREKGYNNPRVIEIFTRLADIESNLYSPQGLSMEMQSEREALKAELESIFENDNPVMKSIAEQIDEKKSKRAVLVKERLEREDDERVEILKLQAEQDKVRNVRDYDYYESEIDKIKERIDQRNEELDLLASDITALNNEYSRYYNTEIRNACVGVSPAPFEKNWAELAMKRMLRYAAENGFDKVAWTTGEQQAERYNISKSVDNIKSEDNNVEETSDGTLIVKNITIYAGGSVHNLFVDANGVVRGREYDGKKLSDIVGKPLAEKLMEPGDFELEGDGLRIGGEGMKAFYDQMIPSFMNKYGKKWGVKVGEVTMPSLVENNTMHSIDVTDAMRESVMQGQPLFRTAKTNYESQFAELQSEYDALDKNDADALNEWRDKKADVVRSYISRLSNKFGLKCELYVFNGGREEEMRKAYDTMVEKYKAKGIEKVPSYESFKKKVSNPKVVATHRKSINFVTFNTSADDAELNIGQFAETLFHENAHRITEKMYSEQEFEQIWENAKKSKNSIAKSVEKLYSDKSDAQKGNEFIAKAIGELVSNHNRLFTNYLMGKDNISAEDLVKKLKYSLPLGKLALTETLNEFKNEYQERVLQGSGSSLLGGGRDGGDIEVSERDGGRNRKRDWQGDQKGQRPRRRLDVVGAATDLAESLGVKLNVIEDVNEITDSNTRRQRAKRGAKAWYVVNTDQVYYVAPNATSIEDAQMSVLHEVVAHKGLRDVVGRENFDKFLDKVFYYAEKEIRSRIVRLASQNGWNFRVATEEYLASLAEEGFDSRENRTFLQKVRDFFMDMLREAKIAIGFNISDNDMRYMLWRTYRMQKSQGAMAVAEDVLMQQKMGVGNFRTRPAGESMTEEEQIIADAKANGTYLKAPNGKDTNLTPKQWAQVRTKAFKKWFGDWEKATRIEKLRKSKDAEITGNEIEASEDLKQYKKNAQMYGRTLQGEYTNADTGAVISLQRGRHNGGINEVLQHNYKDVAHLQSVAAIPQIIENGIYIESQPNRDTDTNPDVKEYQMFVCGLKIGGEDYTVLAKVAVDSKGNRYYDHNLVSVEKGKLIDIANNEQSAISSGFGTTPDTKSTTNSQRKYKELVSILQTNSSKIVDANGEPKVVWHETDWDALNADEAIFDTNRSGYDGLIFFADKPSREGFEYGKYKIPVFLNVRNPKVSDTYIYEGDVYYDSKKYDGGINNFSHRLSNVTHEYEEGRGSVMAVKNPNQIKSATENVGTFDSNNDDVRFRATPTPTTIKDGEAKEIRKKYDKKVNTGRKGTLRMTKYNFIEANQDEMRSLKEYQKLVKEAYGIDKLPSYLDVYALENRIGSAGFEKFNRFVDGEYEVMQQFIDNYIAKGGETLGSVIDYARAKSGLERNREFTVRDYIDKEAKAKLITKKEAEEMLEQVNRELQSDIITPTQADARRQQINNMLNKNKSTEEQITAMREQYEAQRDAYRKDLADGQINYAEFNKLSDEYVKKFTGLDVTDYSGLSATAERMGKKANEWKKAAADIVEAFEGKHDNTNEFWSAVKACNDAVIKEVYDSGMISKQLYDHLKEQLLWYIPMSGFTEDVAEDVYSYIGGETGAFTPPVKKASGRLSESDDPFAIIANKMQGAILQGNRNRIKLAFLNLIQSYPTDLVTEGKVWLTKQADGTWEEKPLEIPADTSSDDAAKLIEEYNEEMRSLKKQGLAREHKNKLNVPYVIQTKSHQNDHEIIAYRNGQQYVMYVNGNPQLAKAINGKLKDNGINLFYKLLDKWNRIESANKTSWNPDFIASNVMRDFEDAVLSTFIDAGVKDAAVLAKTFVAVFPEVVRNISGSENKSGKYAKYFEEFIQNGGGTGYSHLHDVEKWKDINQRRWKRLGLGGKALNTPVQAFNGVGSMFSYLNRIAEDSTRFAAYVHSRQKGRTIGESIKAAKDITTNFNKKGSGATEGIWGFLANFMRRWFLFYNPMVQGIYKHWERMTQSRKRYALVFAAMAGAGYLAAVLNKAATDDDDEEKKYFNQSDYTRRTNIMIYTGDGYIKIPLAPVFREMYALGDIMYSIQCGVITPWEGTKEVVNLVRSLFNLEGQSSLKDKAFSWFRFVIPESTEFVADIEDNVTFTGAPLYKDTPWNKFDPEYQKVYNGTWTPLIRLSKAVNDILPHEDYLHEVDDQMAGKGSNKWINPAVWQHIIEDVTGGVGKTVGDVVTIIDNISNDKEIDLYNIPVAKRFYSKPDERTRGRILKNQYYNATDELEYMNDKYKNYTNYLNETLSDPLEKANKIVEYWDSDEGKRHKLIKDSKSRIDKLNRELKEAKDDAAVEEITLQKEQEMNNLIESLKALESSNK